MSTETNNGRSSNRNARSHWSAQHLATMIGTTFGRCRRKAARLHVQTCRVRDRVGVTGALSTQVRLLSGSGPIYRYPQSAGLCQQRK
jgi:hypothetical protein